jgi:hypothetical protein
MRASASGAGSRTVALEISVLFVVVPREGWSEIPEASLPKEPPLLRDSAARESEVMMPEDSLMGLLKASGSLVTCAE